MNFDAYARRQAQVLFDAFADRLVKDLAKAASQEAQALAAQARQQAEQAGEAALAAARADGEARLAAAQAMNAGLLESLEAAKEEVRTTQAAAQEEVRVARAAAQEELLAAQTAAQEELGAAQTAAQEEVRAAREETRTAQEETRAARKDTQAAHQELRAAQEQALAAQAAAQEEVGAAQTAAQEEARITQAAAQEEIARMRAELEAQLEEREQALRAAREDARLANEALEDVRQESTFARIEADTCRQDREMVVERVGAALSAIDRAASPTDILETLLEPLAHEFARVAVFLVGPTSLTGWRGRGLDSTTDITKLVILRSNDSPLTRAVTQRKRLFVTATAKKPLTGLLGTSDPVKHVVALPVLAGEQVIGVAYAEDLGFSPTLSTFPGVACKIAEMLIDHAMLRLTTKRAAAAHSPLPPAEQPDAFSPARQARRLKVQKGIDVTLDGAESSLVDLSSIGAQILSPLAMPPNRLVKMTLRTKDASLACKGRVIWARFEQPRGTAAARYRVGVKFTDIEEKALEGLMKRHGIAEATG
jgi:chemotaxis protein histidine kinase CheA